jgi:hypothetical protein
MSQRLLAPHRETPVGLLWQIPLQQSSAALQTSPLTRQAGSNRHRILPSRLSSQREPQQSAGAVQTSPAGKQLGGPELAHFASLHRLEQQSLGLEQGSPSAAQYAPSPHSKLAEQLKLQQSPALEQACSTPRQPTEDAHLSVPFMSVSQWLEQHCQALSHAAPSGAEPSQLGTAGPPPTAGKARAPA